MVLTTPQKRTMNFDTFQRKNRNRIRLLLSCPYQQGIVLEVSNFLRKQGANIIQQSDQYLGESSEKTFFMRIEFELPEADRKEKEIKRQFEEVAATFRMNWRFSYVNRLKRMAIFVSKYEHCLLELLWRWKAGELVAEIPLIISNHPDLQEMAESSDITFKYIPVNKENKFVAEEEQLRLLSENDVDFVVLARYMQILSPRFVKHYLNNIINIHHSLLPAFIGARPYEQAYKRGVKIIGATSHYVTDNLDQGPIIEQGVKRLNQQHSVNELKRIGRTIERDVLAKAVSLHLDDRIIVCKNKTVVF